MGQQLWELVEAGVQDAQTVARSNEKYEKHK